MIISGNYKDCRAFIRYADNRDAVDAVIVSHNKEYMTISVRGQFKEYESNEFVTVLILLSSGVHEYHGKLRRSPVDSNSAEIALFKGQLKEDRASKRYTVNTPAVVECLIIDNDKQPLPSPIEIILTNLSTAGVLIKAPVGSFALDDIVEVKLNAGAGITAVNAKIIRLRNIDEATDECGCLLVAAY